MSHLSVAPHHPLGFLSLELNLAARARDPFLNFLSATLNISLHGDFAQSTGGRQLQSAIKWTPQCLCLYFPALYYLLTHRRYSWPTHNTHLSFPKDTPPNIQQPRCLHSHLSWPDQLVSVRNFPVSSPREDLIMGSLL